METGQDITVLLARARAGDADALEAMLPRVYHELRALARRHLETTERQWKQAQERLALDTDTLQLAEKAFALGETDLTALLRARADALEAQALVGQQQVALMAARSRMHQALGVLPK